MGDRPLIGIFLSFAAGVLFGASLPGPHAVMVPLLAIVAPLPILIAYLIPAHYRPAAILPGFFLLGALLLILGHHDSDVALLAGQDKALIIEGTVIEPSRCQQGRVRMVIRADRIFMKGREKRVQERVLLTIYRNGRDFSPGEKIRFPGKLRAFLNFRNPGRYNYERAMRVRGIACAASCSDGRRIVPMGRGHLGFPGDLLEEIRRPVRGLFTQVLSPEDRALYRALILGEKQELTPPLREPFNRAGIAHILAVSGLHIGLVAWLAFAMAAGLLACSYRLMLRVSVRKVAAILTFVPVVAYTGMAGFQVSSQRAMVMALAFLISLILEREKEVWSTLALAGLVILALNPLAVFSVSFQLSFFAVTGILWLTPVLYRKIFRTDWNPKDRGSAVSRVYVYTAGLFCVTLSATLFLLPLTVYYFHRISLVALPANLTVVPILGLWVLPLGLLAAVITPLSQSAAGVVLQMGALGLDCIRAIAEWLTQFSWASIWVITPNLFELMLLYALFPLIWFFRPRRWARKGIWLVLFIIAVDVLYWTYHTQFNPDLKVTFLDVGQGNTALVQLPGRKRILIDGGGFPGDFFDPGRMVVAPFLLRSKIRRIDYLVLSHPQSDHMNGLRFIAAHFSPREFWHNGVDVDTPSYKELMKIVSSKKIKRKTPAELEGGEEISGVKIQVLHPPVPSMAWPGQGRGLGLNGRSLVLKLTYGGHSILFPGDLEGAGEKAAISHAGSLLRSDVLLAPHHGSRGSCTRPFLGAVRPKYCVISCGRGNSFGFPHREAIQKLHAVKSTILRTDQSGAVEVTLSPGGIRVRCFSGRGH